MAGKNKKGGFREFLESKGVDAQVLDREPPNVSDVVLEGDDPFGYIGADAGQLQDHMRLSRVEKNSDIERLKRQGFTMVADHRQGAASGLMDVRMRGVDGGVIMGRPNKLEATYKLARAKKDFERRTAHKQKQETWGGDPEKQGRFSLSSQSTPATVRDN